MIYRIKYSPAFHADMISFISNMEQYPNKELRIVEQLDKRLSALMDAPEMYPVYEDFPPFRKITIEDYLAFYTINKHTEIIQIHRLIYGEMDIPKQLEETSLKHRITRPP